MSSERSRSEPRALGLGTSRTKTLRLIEAEHPLLYDYLLRMTGQVSRAKDTLGELANAVLATPAADTPEFLRSHLYATARRLNADIWNADTAQLTNEAFDTQDDLRAGSGPQRDELLRLDRRLSRLPAWEREPIILALRAQFDMNDVARIMASNRETSEAAFRSGLKRLQDDSTGTTIPLERAVLALPLHPIPAATHDVTTNLSIMIRDLKAARGTWGWARLGLAILAVLIAVLSGFWLVNR